MKLFHVTITGADDGVEDPQELLHLSEEFPFVEWGILFSAPKQGEDRYPSANWLQKLIKVCDIAQETHGKAPNLSAHLCGVYAKNVIYKNEVMLPSKHFKRVQLNLPQKDFHQVNLENLYSLSQSSYPDIEWLFQYRGEEDDFKVEEISEFNFKHSLNEKRTFGVLYDISGGQGISPDAWVKPFPTVRTGYAGGLNPDNLEEQLNKLACVVDEKSVWIDLETGARTDNKFNFNKVRRCLEIASSWS